MTACAGLIWGCSMAGPTFFRRISATALAQRAAELGVIHVDTIAAASVALPPLVYGASFIKHWPLHEEPGSTSWTDTAYTSPEPWVLLLPDAFLHSSAGIACVRGHVIEETLFHTDPQRHRSRPDGDGIWIDVSAAKPLPGAHISVLHGSAASYYHALIDGLGRLAFLPANLLAGADGLVTSPHAHAPVDWLIARLGHQWSLRQTAMAGTLRVEQLVLAGQSDVTCRHHPRLAGWFASLGMFTDAEPATGSRHFYIDRRSAASRPLGNEPAVAAALEAAGLRPVTLEHLGGPAQIALFRHADLVVAPHGAGLANLLFSNPACRVVELQMDAYCHWGFRRLAALKGLHYDCVLGRLQGPWPDHVYERQAAKWNVSVPHVLAAVEAIRHHLP